MKKDSKQERRKQLIMGRKTNKTLILITVDDPEYVKEVEQERVKLYFQFNHV